MLLFSFDFWIVLPEDSIFNCLFDGKGWEEVSKLGFFVDRKEFGFGFFEYILIIVEKIWLVRYLALWMYCSDGLGLGVDWFLVDGEVL